MIYITKNIAIAEGDLSWEFIRSSGPGGQNVNKVATAVQLRFDVARAQGLPPDVRERIMAAAGKRLTSEGVLIINARRFRTQERNRADALERLREIIRSASHAPKKRIKTKPSAASRIRKAQSKQHRSRVKALRRHTSSDQD
jgi:ribosome-associated protein